MRLRLAWLPYAMALQIAVLVVAWNLKTGMAPALLLGVTTLFTCFLLRALFRHKRAMLDTPTSRVASAAQGYVELFGRAQSHGEGVLHSKLTGLPCLWFRYSVEQRRGDRWQRIDHGRSDARFQLRDDSGACLIDPEQADVIPRRTDKWSKGDYRFTEELLLAGDSLYALGDLGTIGGALDAPSQSLIVNRLLTQWKQDSPALLTRFDLDGSGTIDAKEWDLARRAAKREATAEFDAHRARPGQPILRRPADGRPFLVTSFAPQDLARRYRWWFWGHVAVLLASGTAWMVWLYNMGVR